MRVVIFSLLIEEIRNRIDDVVYEDGFLKFYKNNVLFKSFNIQTGESADCELEIKKSFRTLKDKIRTYGV